MGLQPCTATVDFWFYTFAGPVRESESSSLTALTTLTTLFVLLSSTLALHNWDVFMCAHSLVLMSHIDLLESILWAFEQNLSLKSWTLGSSSSFPSSKETMWTWAPAKLPDFHSGRDDPCPACYAELSKVKLECAFSHDSRLIYRVSPSTGTIATKKFCLEKPKVRKKVLMTVIQTLERGNEGARESCVSFYYPANLRSASVQGFFLTKQNKSPL